MAYVPAIVGTARLGNFRLGYQPAALKVLRQTRVRILLAGTDVRVRVAGLSIRDVLNETPNTATFTINSPAPTVGQAFRVMINSDAPRLLFAGTIQTDDRTYQGKPTQLAYPCTAIDDTARVNKRRPFGTFTNISATTVAQYLVTFAPGFSAAGIAASLPLVTITFDGSTSFMGCLAQLATLMGGYCNAEDGIVYLFLTDATNPPDAIDSTPNRFLNDPPIQVSRDDSQLATRVYGKGHAEAVPIDVAAGETIVPVDDAVMFNAAGGKAIASTTPDGAASEILAYTGVQLGGVGSLVGPGVVPSVAPVLTLTTGTGVETGTHLGAYTFVTAAGETLPSPTRSLYVGPVADPAVAEVVANYPVGANAQLTVGATYRYEYTLMGGVGETLPSPASNAVVCTTNAGGNPQALAGSNGAGFLNAKLDSNGIVRTVLWYRSVNGGTYRWVPNLAGLDTTYSDAAIAGNQTPPGANSTTGNQVAVSGIALGPTGTTQRKYYRTVAGGAQLKLQQTIANNTATTGVTDATADASLGANAPTADTSGLVQTFGQVNAGSTSMPTSGTAPFSTGGGWVKTSADDLVRYTGITGNTLTGIPAAGAGAIITSILYNSQVISAPALTGVTGLTKALVKGAPVRILVQRDDLLAQAAAAARESTSTYTSDGIHEVTITDDRRGEASLMARCDAHLALFANPIVTVAYATRDVKTKSGKPVSISLASPAISETLMIQDVTITEIDVAPGLAPRFMATASSVRFSLEDFLRRMNALLES